MKKAKTEGDEVEEATEVCDTCGEEVAGEGKLFHHGDGTHTFEPHDANGPQRA